MTDAGAKAPLLGLEWLKLRASFGIVTFYLGSELPLRLLVFTGPVLATCGLMAT